MTKKNNLLGIILACITGASLLTAMLLKTFLPRIILPKFDAISVIFVILVSLVADHYFAKGSKRNFLLIPLYGALIFGLFPYTASFVSPMDALKLAIMGAAAFTVITVLFDTITDRLSSGPALKIAPFVSAFGIFLAAQGLMGII